MKTNIIRNCEKCNKEDSINCISGLCPSCSTDDKHKEFKELVEPTQQEIKEYMELHNSDEVGINNQWNMEEAEYFLLNSDKYYYKNKEFKE